MSLDDLISKYLDGELSPENDAELRQLINENVTAKEDFDAHVLIHAAMKEDASTIRPSMNLVGKTEDKILSRYLREKPAVSFEYERPGRRVFAFAGVAFAVLVLGFISISDVSLFYPNVNNLSSVLNSEKARLMNSNSVQQSTLYSDKSTDVQEFVMSVPSESRLRSSGASNLLLANSTIRANNNTASLPLASVPANSPASFETENGTGTTSATLVETASVEDNSITASAIQLSDKSFEKGGISVLGDHILVLKLNSSDLMKTQSDFVNEKQNVPVLKTVGSGSAINQPVQAAKLIPMTSGSSNLADINPNFYGKISDIKLTSFLGTEVFQGGFATNSVKVISNFSQGVAYDLSDNQRVGFDFGYSSYSYNDTRIGRLPGFTYHDDNQSSAGQNKILVKDVNNNSWIEYPFTVSVQQQMMWGAGFYEKTLLNKDFLKIDGRVGFGGTNEGPLGYTRLFANIKLFNWFSINAGADARAFLWKNSAFKNSKSDIKSAISIIYGFEIKL